MLAAALSLLFLQAADLAGANVQSAAASDGAPEPSGRYAECIAAIEVDADAAYEAAMGWANETGDLEAYRCAATALIDQGRFDQGARRLESLASAAEGHHPAILAGLFSQAGHAWLLARDGGRARSAFTRAIAALGNDREALPDMLIDRSLAYTEEGDHRHAEEDLSRALDLRPDDALALRLRAMSRMRQNVLDLAAVDAERALAIDPRNIESGVVLGHIRESQRIGRPINENTGEPAEETRVQ
ncbi:MAG: hypothetical protein AB7O04_11200 [Hyphomonadaceae bacterium]